MTDRKVVIPKQTTIGDAAVDGLLAGGGAGLLMLAILVVAGLAAGDTLATILSRFNAGGSGSAGAGLLTHLAVAAVYGIIFALLAWFTPRSWRRRIAGWLAGLVYGLLLLALAEIVLLPGTQSPLQEVPAVTLALAHIVYGVSLGRFINYTGAFSGQG